MKEKVTTIQRRGKKSVQKDSVLYITPKGDTWKEHKLYIEDFAEDLYAFIREREEMEGASSTMTAAFATAVSRCFKFEGFSYEEVPVAWDNSNWLGKRVPQMLRLEAFFSEKSQSKT